MRTIKWMNGWMEKLIRWLVVLGLVAALPLGAARMAGEQSSRTVELVFDYRDLIEISEYKANPVAWIQEQLDKLADTGVRSLAVYESTLLELKQQRRIQLLSSQEAAILMERPSSREGNYTYLLFNDQAVQEALQPLIERAFTRLEVQVEGWSFGGRQGLVIAMPLDDAQIRPMDPDPITMADLRKQGFRLVVRLSDNRSFHAADMETLLLQLKQHGVRTIIFGGKSVTGLGDNAETGSLYAMAELMKQSGIGFATIEVFDTSKKQQGEKQLAYLTDYDRVVRLHSISEKDAKLAKSTLSDRLLLAVKDRNIRMIYLNAAASKDLERAVVTDPMHNVYETLSGPDGAIERIEREGFRIGFVEPSDMSRIPGEKPLRAVVLLGGVALIALLTRFFAPRLLTPIFALGLVGAAGLYVYDSSLLLQAIALGAAISAPTIACIYAIQAVKQRGVGTRMRFALRIFGSSVLISLAGAVYIVGLLNSPAYFLVLDQFRGVSLLHAAPIVLVAWYIFFDGVHTPREAAAKLSSFLRLHVRISWVVAFGIAAAAAYYYMSRTGNQGEVTGLERSFRALLENTLGVRPRTKEFLFAHPLFIVAAYYALVYRNAFYLFVIGVIGQLSIVDTFAHLHTPLDISLLRVLYGVILGAVIGMIYIAVIEVGRRSWKRWVQPVGE